MDDTTKLAVLYGAVEDQQKIVTAAITELAQERIKLSAVIDAINNASSSIQTATGAAASNAVTQTLSQAPQAAVGALNAARNSLEDAVKRVRAAGAWISWKFTVVFVVAGATAVVTNYAIGRFTLPDRAEIDALRVEKAELETTIADLANRGGRIKLNSCGGRICIEASSNQGKDTVGNPAPMGSWRTTDGRDVALVIPRGY